MRPTCLSLLALLALFLAPAAARAADPTLTQSFPLVPGWNAVFVEVAPANPDPAAVFGSIANVEQVWAFFPTRSPVQFITDPAAGLFNKPGWRVWLPASRPDAAALTTLKAVTTHQAYLIKLGGTANATLAVAGPTSYRGVKWQPDGFTLTGLPVDSSTSITAGDYFFNSPAHKGQARYQLNANGTWLPVADSAALVAGRAYWIFTKGGSDLSAPMEMTFDSVRALDFGPDQESKTITLRNRSAYAASVSLANPDGLPLVTAGRDGSGNVTWTPLATLSQSIPAGGSVAVRLGARRKLLTADTSAFLRVAGGGVAFRVPVSLSLPRDAATIPPSLARPGGRTSDLPPPNPNAGLWIGTAAAKAVSEANSTAPNTPTATPAEFTLRLIIHVDASGAAKLLKDVTVMRRKPAEGSTEAPPFVLVSDPARLADFDAPQKRDGSPYSYRVTSVGYDFAGTSVALAGTWGSPLTGTVTVPRTLPTNPFRHKYHPDHDDLDPNFQPLGNNLPPDQQEVWAVSRALTLSFDPPPGGNAPDAGYTTRTGTYQEVIAGLHKNNLVVTGAFSLRRVNPITEINPAP